MKKIIFIYISMLHLLVWAQSQQPADTIHGKLLALNEPKTVVNKYVNFDVFKFLMIGHGRNTGSLPNGTGLSVKFQALFPYALLKNAGIPIAWGVHFGASKITIPHTSLTFSGNELTAATSDKNINSTMQRTGYIGFMGLFVRQVKSWGITFLAGASLDYNMFSRLRIRTRSANTGSPSGKFINRFSVPLHIQVSRSKKQFLSWGVYGSYDTRPRFKGSGFRNLRQVVIGTSVAFII